MPDLETQSITVGNLRQKHEKLPGAKVSLELIELVRYSLVVDQAQRPEALEALRHPYVQSLFIEELLHISLAVNISHRTLEMRISTLKD